MGMSEKANRMATTPLLSEAKFRTAPERLFVPVIVLSPALSDVAGESIASRPDPQYSGPDDWTFQCVNLEEIHT